MKSFKFYIGFLIIILFVWFRILREKKPQTLIDILNVTYIEVITICSISILLFLLLNEIQKLQKYKRNSIFFKLLDKPVIQKILTVFHEYLITSPEYFYNILTENISLAWLIEKPASYFTAYFPYKRTFVIIMMYLPQVCLATVFLVEICIYNQKVYFFTILNLLLFFLVTKVILFMFKNYSSRRLKNFELFLDVKYTTDGISFALKSPDRLPKEIALDVIISKYNYMCQFWFVYKLIYDYMVDINAFYQLFLPYIRIYMFSCFLLGWIYILFFIYI